MLGLKLGQTLEKPCVCPRVQIFSAIIIKLDQKIYHDEIPDEFENGSCWVKTRSLGQILEKPCVRSEDHIFRPIIMKRGQNVCLDEISDKYENGSYRIFYDLK